MAISPALSQWFASVGVVPPGRRAADVLATANDFAAGVRALLESWRELLDRGPSARTASRAEDCPGLLELWHSQQSECWAAGDPRIPPRVNDWLGEREWWWSRPVPPGVRMAVVSSRLPRLADSQGT